MFIEQPTPPNPPAQVQVQPDTANSQSAASPTPAQRGVAAPEAIPVAPQSTTASAEAPAPVAEPTPVPSRAAEPAPPAPTASEPSPSPVVADAKAQRRQEIEQKLIELTTQARAKQKEQQQQQAAMEAAKYLEAGEVNQAEQATSKLTLPADVKAKLEKRIAEAKAKKDKVAIAPGARQGLPQAQVASGAANAAAIAPAYAAPAGGYSTQPLLPSMPIGLSFAFEKLMGKGNFKLTFPLGVMAPVTSGFGWRIHPIDGSPRFHRGIDFGAPYGSPVVAAMAGVVEAAGYMDGYGLTVVVRHNNQQTLYAHLSQVFVKAGDTLKRGQLLGQVGSTGNSTGPHLHFEVHQQTDQGWVALDPAAVMNQAIAIAQKQPAIPFKGQLVNLSVSGLLDVNAASPGLTAFAGERTFLSSLLSPAPDSQAPVRVPISLIPPAIPEFGWLISPLVENLLSDQSVFITLPGLLENPQTISFQPIPSLTTQATETVAANPWVASATKSPQVRLANSNPLAHLTVAEKLPGTVNIASLRGSVPRKPRVQNPADLKLAQAFKPIQVTEQGLQSLKLEPRNR